MAAKKKGQASKGARAKKAQPSTRKKAKERRETAGQLVDQDLIRALAHPLRVQLLTILNDRMASPNELAKELDEGLSQVSYHVKVLKDFDCIEMVKTTPRRGAVEHYYKAKDAVLIPSWTLKLLPRSAQRRIYGAVLGDIEEDVGQSLGTGRFDDRPDCVVGRDPRKLDPKARERAEELAAEFFEKYRGLEVETEQRVRDGETHPSELMDSTAVVLVFGSSVGKRVKGKKGSKKKKK